jgi:hypothetical protein
MGRNSRNDKIGFLTTEKIIAALGSVQIDFSDTSRQTGAVPQKDDRCHDHQSHHNTVSASPLAL